MNRKLRGTLLVALGLVMILAGAGCYLLQKRQDKTTGRHSAVLLDALTQQIEFDPTSISTPGSPTVSAQPAAEKETSMPKRTLSGYDLIGILRIPSVGIELPVLSNWSDSLLKVAPCRYSGSVEHGNLILLGHSYKSQLEPLEDAAVGDVVQFTDTIGRIHWYEIAAIDVIHGTDADLLPSEHPLTIFTCTRDSTHRIVVRCQITDSVFSRPAP